MTAQNGKITTCENSGCGWKCCQFQQGNYIVTYPGELEKAAAEGIKIDHLKIIDADYKGGAKVVCVAQNTADCDGGLKPFDCKAYPFFPADDAGELFIKGEKCPLQIAHLGAHAQSVRDTWHEILAHNPAAQGWPERIEMVGYTAPFALPRRMPMVA